MPQSLIALLRWSEKYTKTDMVYLASGGFWLAVAQLAASIAGFILTIVLANFLPPETLGEYRFLLAGLALLGIVALPGMRAALRESTPKGHLGNLRIAFNSMMRYGALGSIVALGVGGYYFFQGNTNLALGFAVIALALPFFDSSTAYLEYLNALKKFKHATAYTTITRFVLVTGTVTVAFVYSEYAFVILAAFLLGHIVPGLIFHKKTESTYAQEDSKSDPALITYAKHLTAMAALGLIAGQLDKFFVWEFIGAAGLATLYIAYVLPQETGRFLGLVSTLAFPKFATADPTTIKQTLPKKIALYFMIIASGVCVYILLAPYIFAVLFSQYTDAVAYSQVLMLSVLAFAFSPIKTFLTTQKATTSLYILSIFPPALRIGVAVLLIAPFGIWGAVWALLAESVLRALLLVFLFIWVRT